MKISFMFNKKNNFRLTKNVLILIVVLFSFLISGCCAYSFTGASAPEHIKTIAIPFVEDRSGSGQNELRENFTNKLNQKFIEDNTLQVTDRSKANSVLECTITSLLDAPAVITAGETVAQKKITISVQVTYKDLVKKKTVYERSFSQYSNYPTDGDVAARNAAINDAIDKITDDILLDTVSGW